MTSDPPLICFMRCLWCQGSLSCQLISSTKLITRGALQIPMELHSRHMNAFNMDLARGTYSSVHVLVGACLVPFDTQLLFLGG